MEEFEIPIEEKDAHAECAALLGLKIEFNPHKNDKMLHVIIRDIKSLVLAYRFGSMVRMKLLLSELAN